MVPLPGPVLEALHVMALMRGLGSDRGRADVWLQLGLFLQLAFHGLLRPGEALKLKRGHVSIPDDFIIGGEPCVTLCIIDPTTKRFGGRLQHAVIRDRATVNWISWYVAGLQDDDLLLTLRGARLRAGFKELCT